MKVDRNTVIGELLKAHPDTAVIMLEHGLHCVGCHANVFDTIENGCRVHGMSDEDVDGLITQLNEFVSGDVKKSSGVSLTDAAAKKIASLIDPQADGLRIRVQPGGCSGFVYEMSFDKRAENDKVVEHNGVKLLLDSESFGMLDGSEVDFVDTLNQSGFKIKNPNAKHNCGCGKSFG